VTFTGNEAGIKLALTACAEFMVTEQGPVPEQAPPQPANTEAGDEGAAFRVTTVPFVYTALHVAPQLIVASVLVTVPVPLPVSETVNPY
jgi:hypothetical protein